MGKQIVIVFIVAALLGLFLPTKTNAFGISDIRKIIEGVKTALDLYKAITGTTGVPGYVPHKFPFGGHIISSENACSLKFRAWFPICTPLTGCIMVPTPSISTVRFGRAIEVGDPVPTLGKVITFPYVSDLYRNRQENRVGPWALGLGFTPFPLDKINDALKTLRFPDPLTPCNLQYPFCVDNIHIDCTASGEKDINGEDIYKVILKLGTSPD